MKLAIHVDGTAVRGNERQLLMLAEWLMAQGHEVVVACRTTTPTGQAFHALGARTTAVRPRGDADIVNQLRFARWLRRERPDALLLGSWKRFPSAAGAAKLVGVPRVVLRVGIAQAVPADGIRGWKFRRAFRRVHAVIANAPALRDHYARLVPTIADRIHPIRNAARVTRAAPGPLRELAGAAPGDVVMLAAGGLERRKGFDVLIEAAARLDPSVRVAIAGEGPLADELAALAAARGVGDRVRLLGQRADLPALLASADAFVLPSRADSMANAMLEAMAAGLPVVATDVPGTADALTPAEGRGPAGWMVPRGDTDALAAAMAEVAAGLRGDAADVRARADEGRWRIENWFTVDRMASAYAAVLFGAPATTG